MAVFDFIKKIVGADKPARPKAGKPSAQKKKTALAAKPVRKAERAAALTRGKAKKSPARTQKKPVRSAGKKTSAAARKTAAPIKGKTAPAAGMRPAGKSVGRVIHYFNKISVGIIKLSAPLKVNDRVHILGARGDFKQTVTSMQCNHKDIQAAAKGKEIGIKVDRPVHENDRVYRIE